MHPFRAYISMFSEFTDEDWAKIQPFLTYKVVQANRMILKPGKICNCLYFLENGTIRYFVSRDNEDQTLNKIEAPFLFTSAHSFAQQIPSTEGIQAVEESYLWIMSKDDAYQLMEVPSWRKFVTTLNR